MLEDVWWSSAETVKG